MKIRNMMRRYYSVAVAKVYYIGFIVDGELYMFIIRGEIPEFLLRETQSSEESKCAQVRIQVKLTNARAQYIHDKRVVHLGPASVMNYKDKYNRGHHFEHYIVERFTNQTWKVNNTPWYEAGDVIINGEHVQVKFQDAEVTNEDKLKRAGLWGETLTAHEGEKINTASLDKQANRC